MHSFIHECTDACMYACMHAFIPFTHARMQSCIHSCMHACMHAGVHTIHSFMHECTHTFIHSCMHACVHPSAFMHACNDAFIHSCTLACIDCFVIHHLWHIFGCHPSRRAPPPRPASPRGSSRRCGWTTAGTSTTRTTPMTCLRRRRAAAAAPGRWWARGRCSTRSPGRSSAPCGACPSRPQEKVCRGEGQGEQLFAIFQDLGRDGALSNSHGYVGLVVLLHPPQAPKGTSDAKQKGSKLPFARKFPPWLDSGGAQQGFQWPGDNKQTWHLPVGVGVGIVASTGGWGGGLSWNVVYVPPAQRGLPKQWPVISPGPRGPDPPFGAHWHHQLHPGLASVHWCVTGSVIDVGL